MKKVLCIALIAVLALAVLVGCGSTATGVAAGSAVTSEAAAETGKDVASIKIGVIQLVEHDALDAACNGFVDGLVAAGFSKDNIDVQNAQGEQANCVTIANKFVNDKVDLILAIATPAAQAAAQATTTIPILVTAVTDPASAGLVASNEVPGGNVSGTSDMNPVTEQIALLQKLVPDAKTVGVMYCSSEDNSILQAEMAVAAIEALGLEAKTYTAADSNEVQAVTQSTVGKVDALYIPTDNLFASTMDTVALITEPNKIPVICGESGMVEKGGLATYGIDYYKLGQQTAEQAVDLFVNGADISKMPIAYSPEADLAVSVNAEMAKSIGVTIPEDLK
ncbi:MAG: ABC transporter substrate-binding protein [Oscillospiraceae bacterium]|nr:ABC transporter substrate-binding protein [Oscillospiraceae bacterium]